MSRRRYLVMYDISDPKRLRRVHDVVKGHGHSLQYSVFVCDLSSIQLIGLKWQLGDEIDHTADSIAILDLGDAEKADPSRFSFLGLHPPLPSRGPVVL